MGYLLIIEKIYSDYVIIGVGILNLTIAYEFSQYRKVASILILQKESDIGKHGSRCNSGVLHPGIYYTENSLKAKFCRNGVKDIMDFLTGK